MKKLNLLYAKPLPSLKTAVFNFNFFKMKKLSLMLKTFSCLHKNKLFPYFSKLLIYLKWMHLWTATSEFGTYRLCEQRRFRRACASAQSRQNLRCSLIQAVSQEEPSDRKPDPWSLWMAGHAQLKYVMTECSKTQIRLTGPIYLFCCTFYMLGEGSKSSKKPQIQMMTMCGTKYRIPYWCEPYHQEFKSDMKRQKSGTNPIKFTIPPASPSRNILNRNIKYCAICRAPLSSYQTNPIKIIEHKSKECKPQKQH